MAKRKASPCRRPSRRLGLSAKAPQDEGRADLQNSRRLLRKTALLRHAVGRKAVLRQRFLDAVVEHVDLADAARFLAGRDLAANLTRDAHELLDLLNRAHLALAIL